MNDLTVAECKAEKELIELEIKGMLQRFSDKYKVDVGGVYISSGTHMVGDKIARVSITVNV